MAHTTIIGRLGKDPELHTARDGGTVYARMSVAWSERFKDRAGDWVDGPTTWVSVTVFGRQAENVAASLDTGMLVVCTGDMRTELWASDDGEKPAVTMRANVVAAALHNQVVQVQKDGRQHDGGGGAQQHQPQPQQQPQQHQGNTWGTPAPTGQQPTADDDEPPF